MKGKKVSRFFFIHGGKRWEKERNLNIIKHFQTSSFVLLKKAEKKSWKFSSNRNSFYPQSTFTHSIGRHKNFAWLVFEVDSLHWKFLASSQFILIACYNKFKIITCISPSFHLTTFSLTIFSVSCYCLFPQKQQQHWKNRKVNSDYQEKHMFW